MPGPRMSRPVCCTSTSRGGSHFVMIIVSRMPRCRPPGRGSPVRAASRPCSRWAGPPTVRTSVASIHSPCASQSVSTAHTRSGGASTSIRSTSSGTGLLLVVGGCGVVVPLRGRLPVALRSLRGEPLGEGGDLRVAFLEHEGELLDQPVHLGHAVAAEDRGDPQCPDVVRGHRTGVGHLHRRAFQLGGGLGLAASEQQRGAEEEQPADDEDADDEGDEREHQASSGPWVGTCCMPPPPSPARRAESAAWITARTSAMSSVTVIRSRSAALIVPVSASVPRTQSMSPDQYAVPKRITGKRVTLRVCTRVSASKSSSRVPKPPGRITKACAYFTNMVLRTKK